MASDPSPKYVYKILPSAPSDPFPDVLPLSALDAKDGFVHLSTATQVPNTANLFFNETSSLWVVKLAFEAFPDLIKFEGGFPHLYGNFGAKDVHSVQRLDKIDGKTWVESMQSSTWLE